MNDLEFFEMTDEELKEVLDLLEDYDPNCPVSPDKSREMRYARAEIRHILRARSINRAIGGK